MKRKSLYLTFGILLLLGGLFGVLLTIASAVTPDLGTGIAIFFGVCSAGFLAPAVLLFYLYWRASAHDKVLQTVGAVLRSVREISVQDVARRVGKTPADAELLISQSIAEGYAQGFVDPREGKFVATAWGGFAPGQVPQIVIQAPAIPQAVYPPPYAPFAAAPPSGSPESRFCRECGSRIEKVPGQTYWQCPHCGNIQ
jgi:hypothetical protein